MFRAFSTLAVAAVFLLPEGVDTATLKPSGLKSISSAHSVAETADRVVTAIEERGLKIFAQIDHAANAQSVGDELRPTRLVLFGNPQLGTQLMQCSQTIAIDLPMKFLVWEDRDGGVRIGYNEADYLAKRHEIKGCDLIVDQMKAPLETLARQAAGL